MTHFRLPCRNDFSAVRFPRSVFIRFLLGRKAHTRTHTKPITYVYMYVHGYGDYLHIQSWRER